MRYLVIEVHPGHCVVLDEKGSFYRVANLGYETGDIVRDVVFMEDIAEKEKKGKRRIKQFSAIAAVAACFLLVLLPVMDVFSQDNAQVTLSINPQVTMEVNGDDEVTEIEGNNEDGRELIEGYSCDGKGVDKVTGQLVDRAVEMGFLAEGETINLDIGADDGRRANGLGEKLDRYLEKQLGEKYSIVITANGMELVNRHVIIYEEETTSEPTAAPTENQGSGGYQTPSGGGYYGDSGYGSSDYGGSGSGGAAGGAPAAGTSPAALVSPGNGSGDSGYGDSGYGDSGYDSGDSGYD